MSEQELALIGLLGAGAAATGLALMAGGAQPPSLWYKLDWPREIEAEDVVAFLRNLASDRRRHVIGLETVVAEGRLTYRLGLAKDYAATVLAQLQSYLPGVSAELIDHQATTCPGHAWQLRQTPTHRALKTSNIDHVSRALIAALSSTGKNDTVVFQWLLGPRLAPTDAPKQDASSASWSDVFKGMAVKTSALETDVRKSVREKTQEPGFRAVCRIGVAGGDQHPAQAIANRILAALRTVEAPGVRLTLRRDNPDRLAWARAPRSWPVAVNVHELAALSSWPLGDGSYPGIVRTTARRLPASGRVSQRGRVISVATYPGQERPLALKLTDSLQHLHILGPTGVGKSTLMLNLILQDIAAGRSVAVIDPKGDLIEDVLARVPKEREEDIVVLDPADEKRPVGLNVLQGGNRPAELVADQVLAVFHDLYRENWGPRTQDILHASLLTLAGKPGMTLCALPILLSNRRFRKNVVGDVTDSIALKPFWAWFDSLSEGERQQAIAPVMNKLRAFLLRPRMRAVIGQAEPAFDINSVFTKKKVLLVSLAKGLLGPEAAALLGSLVVAHLWQAALGRVRIPSDRRSPVFIYIDEFQDYLHLPTDLAEVLAQARGLGVGLTLAHQHLAQLTPALRSAVLANARSRVCFQLSHEDAKLIAAGSSEVTTDDLQGLGLYETYSSLVAEGNVTPYASGRTYEPPAVTGEAATIRSKSRSSYGRDLQDIEAELSALIAGGSSPDEAPIGRRRVS
ncbi:MAG: type IV secretion system DNA-binding domain-containing protein [Actinomycetia bacterium]|nr:type IV secretion system DNA-binding domain-containing protein [Actinomycetes bacterium]